MLFKHMIPTWSWKGSILVVTQMQRYGSRIVVSLPPSMSHHALYNLLLIVNPSLRLQADLFICW